MKLRLKKEKKEKKERRKKKKDQDGQLANKEKKCLAETAQVLRLITLAASIAVTKAEEEKEAEEAFSIEVILIYTLVIIIFTVAAQRFWDAAVRGVTFMRQRVVAQPGSLPMKAAKNEKKQARRSPKEICLALRHGRARVMLSELHKMLRIEHKMLRIELKMLRIQFKILRTQLKMLRIQLKMLRCQLSQSMWLRNQKKCNHQTHEQQLISKQRWNSYERMMDRWWITKGSGMRLKQKNEGCA